MKRNTLKYLVTTFFSVALTISCGKSFLENPSQGSLNETVLSNKAGIYGLLVGAYSALDGQNVGGGEWPAAPDNWVYGSVAAGEAHKGSDASDQPPMNSIATWTTDPSNSFMGLKWRACYEGIARCNSVIRVSTTSNIDENDKKQMIAEARFLRGHYYFELKKMFNMVPWIDETATTFKIPNDKDIWPMIEEDFKHAMANLGNTAPEAGRANKWAAASYLGKAYIYQKKFTEAIPIFTDVIANGQTAQGVKYDLNEKYADNFDAATKNGKESVFAVQMSANDGSGGIANANQGGMLNFPYGGPFSCCGFFQPSLDLANSFRTGADGLPFLDTYNSEIIKTDLGVGSDQAFTPYTGAIDPRLDWTVGRRAIPYHDWGLYPGKSWVRDQAYGGPYAPKKNIFWKATADKYWDKSSWAPGTAININLIRFADVLLMAAEAEAQAGSLSKALEYVNRVRQRAANPAGFLKAYVDPADPGKGFSTAPAANYVIKPYAAGAFANKDFALKAIYFERKIELGLEGHRFFDLSRWGIAQETINKYYAFEKQYTSDIAAGHFTAPKNNYYPIPLSEIDLSKENGQPTLKQNEGY